MLSALFSSLTLTFRQPNCWSNLLHGLRWCLAIAAVILLPEARAEKSVTLAWDPSPTPTVVGYTVQYGTNSGQYSEFLLLGIETTAVVPDLLEGVTYYFVVTAHTDEGLESDPSNELAYTVPDGTITYLPPSLNSIGDLIIDEDAGRTNINLVGLSAGITSSNSTVTATSSNPSLIADPSVTYPASDSVGFLEFTPTPNSFGSATITVTVDNLQPVNNRLVRTFTVTVYSINDQPTLATLTNLTLETDAPPQSVDLTQIGAGAQNENELLSVSAESSNTDLVPTPQISYTSPSSTGVLTFAPVAGTNGTTTITVTVSDGQSSISRSFEVTINAPPPPPALATYFIEAEDGVVRSPMIVASSVNASSGRYVYSQSSEQGDLSFSLTAADADDYIVWCRILSPNTSTDSFYVSLDGGPETIYRTAQNIWSKSWQWTRINQDELSEALLFRLTTGTHTFRFRSRESTTLLDSLYITNNRDFVPVHLTLAKTPNVAGSVELSFQSAAGYRYAIDTTSDFLSWSNVWSVPTNLPTTQIIRYADYTDGAEKRFYRVRVNP